MSPGANISNLRYSTTKFLRWRQQRQAAWEQVNLWSSKQLVKRAALSVMLPTDSPDQISTSIVFEFLRTANTGSVLHMAGEYQCSRHSLAWTRLNTFADRAQSFVHPSKTCAFWHL
jgi:hypothetical protein